MNFIWYIASVSYIRVAKSLIVILKSGNACPHCKVNMIYKIECFQELS
jgi:hypothetical protein